MGKGKASLVGLGVVRAVEMKGCGGCVKVAESMNHNFWHVFLRLPEVMFILFLIAQAKVTFTLCWFTTFLGMNSGFPSSALKSSKCLLI